MASKNADQRTSRRVSPRAGTAHDGGSSTGASGFCCWSGCFSVRTPRGCPMVVVVAVGSPLLVLFCNMRAVPADARAASQMVLGSVGLPLAAAKARALLIPGRDVKAVNERGAPPERRPFISCRGMFPQSRMSTDTVVVAEWQGPLFGMARQCVVGIEFGFWVAGQTRRSWSGGQRIRGARWNLRGGEPSSLRREEPLQRSYRLCGSAGKGKGKHW